MIGNPEWFQRRKIGGWGISPKTWQGWVYIALILIPFAAFQAMPFWDVNIRIGVTAAWIIFLLIDVTHIMLSLEKDERESKIEALSERNAAWAMMLIMILGIVYQSITSALNQQLMIDWFLAAALIAGTFAKTASNIILERKAL